MVEYEQPVNNMNRQKGGRCPAR